VAFPFRLVPPPDFASEHYQYKHAEKCCEHRYSTSYHNLVVLLYEQEVI
jgi:hypothetical protein